MEIFTWTILILVFGEAALLFLVSVLIKGGTSWNTRQNNFFLISDMFFSLLTGVFLVLNRSPFWITATTSFLTATHLYRAYHYLAKKPSTFCFNIPLFIVNSLKLIGLIILMF